MIARSQGLVTLQEASDRFSVSERTLRRYIAAGRLTAYRLGPRAIRVREEDLVTLMRPIPTADSA